MIDKIFDLMANNLDFRQKIFPFLLYYYLQKNDRGKIEVLGNKMQEFLKEGDFFLRKVLTSTLNVLEIWFLEDSEKFKGKSNNFLKNYENLIKSISKETLIFISTKDNDYKRAIYYLEQLIVEKLSKNIPLNSPEISNLLIELFEVISKIIYSN